MEKRKKLLIYLCVVLGVVLVIVGIINSKNKLEKKEYKEIIWKIAYGNKIPTEYEKFKAVEYEKYTFNLEAAENDKNFDVSLPKNTTIELLDSNVIRYVVDNISIEITKTTTSNLEEETEKVKLNNEPVYEKIYIENAKYDKDIFAIILETAKFNGDKSQMFFSQEVKIYIKASNYEYALIKIKGNQKRIDKETISTIINSIVVKNKRLDFCNKTKCNIKLKNLHNSLNNEISLNINNKKYVINYNEGIGGTAASFVTKEYANAGGEEENSYKKLTNINLKILYNIDENYLNFIENGEEVNINGKKFIRIKEEKNLENNVTQYKGTYVLKKDNVAVILYIDSRLNNIDKVAKDFLQFEIK